MDANQPGVSPETSLRDWGPATSVLWDALFNDAGVMAFVMRRDGVVVWMNELTASMVPAEAETPMYHHLCSMAMAHERMSVASQVVETGEPVALVGMSGGETRRSTYRSIPGTELVLVTCRSLVTEATCSHDRAIDGVKPRRAEAEDAGPIASLTPREREVLTLIGNGLTTQQIADELGRSVKTVEWHRLSLGTKLNASNRVELARIAIHAGLSPVTGAAATEAETAG